MKYRAHIDGLRSLAIVPVVLYHAGVTWLPGGFVGVDVFFVISGYLITSILMSDLDNGTFSIVEFYRRRILRIVPLFTVVLLTVLTVGYFILFRQELKELGETAIAAALFVSNIYFWQTTSYFETESSAIPLLHTWSLGVEEQFYIGFPILLYFLHRWARQRLTLLLLAVIVASLALSVVGLQVAKAATFYMLPTRAWELGAGALIAVAGAPALHSRLLRELVVWAGIALVAAPMIYLNEAIPFPGLNAVPPVLGATILIGYADGTSVGRMLKWQPLVYVGLISYALYLWHWPVIVFHSMIFGPALNVVDVGRVVLISVILAILSRPLVENPFRRKSSWRSRNVLVAGSAMLIAIGAAGFVYSSGLTVRAYPADVLSIVSYAQYTDTKEYREQFRAGSCFLDDSFPADAQFDINECLQLDLTKPNILLLGDSHAAQLSGGLRAEYPEFNFLQATSAGCQPIADRYQDERCRTLMDFVLKTFLPSHRLDGIIVAGRWGEGSAPGVTRLAQQLSSFTKHVLVVGPTVIYPGSVPYALARQLVWSDDGLKLQRPSLVKLQQINHDLEMSLSGTGITFRALLGRLCDERNCIAMDAGVPLQFDSGHFTLAGAKFISRGLLDGWQDSSR